MQNPFSEAVDRIESYISRLRGIGVDPILLKVCRQLRLLEVTYRSMIAYDMQDNMSVEPEKDYEEMRCKSIKAVLDYFQFISLLNQLGRILDEDIPNYNRVRFFRNKVWEHWDEYTGGITGSHYQSKGNPAVPSTGTVYSSEERKKVKSDIDSLLCDFGLTIEIENIESANISDFKVEEIYSVLEKIDPTLNSRKKGDYIIPNSLIRLLFQFGFPAPIPNVYEYSTKLVSMIEKKFSEIPRSLTS